MSNESNDVDVVRYHPGYLILEREIQKEFDREIKNLRKCLKDPTFYKTRGKLDALEWVLKLPELIKSRG